MIIQCSKSLPTSALESCKQIKLTMLACNNLYLEHLVREKGKELHVNPLETSYLHAIAVTVTLKLLVPKCV